MARDFMMHLGFGHWSRTGYGTLITNAFSWLAACQDYPHVIIRFEDLRQDPAGALRSIIELTGETVDEARLESAVMASDRQVMTRIEERERQAGDTTSVFPCIDRPEMFLKARQDKNRDLPEALRDTFWKRWTPLAQQLGYGPQGVLDSAPALEGLNVFQPANSPCLT
jgi:hypothetical protein